MIMLSRTFFSVFVFLGCVVAPTFSATAGTFEDGGDLLISGMMLFVGNEEKVYVLDKAEGNAATVKGHPAWGSVWDINTHQVEVMDVRSNVFCSSGMHLPNGSFVTFGGNNAVGRGGQLGEDTTWNPEYQDFDGGLAIRVLNPCHSSDNWNSPRCQWFDDPTKLAMHRRRWYSAAEPLEDGRVIIIGGFVNGGYINRPYPNPNPENQGENTYEFFPPVPDPPRTFQFLIRTSGLNAYAHTFLMPSGQLFVQANISTALWDYNANTERRLPDMPKGVVRVYPASGAVAMLPLTPANNYTPTILFCGGSDMPDDAWGDYGFPRINTWVYPASKDCQRITPEPQDGSDPVYVQDDDMLEGRSMGQFIILPNGKLLVVNGALNGTAGYSQRTGQTPTYAQMPFGESLASGPVLTPAIYDPDAPRGQRWSNEGLGASTIPRMYHSSAMLLPDASVMIAGSNPNVDVNLTTVFPTTYQAEIFYPPYFSAPYRPAPIGMPKTMSYGGAPFDITIPASSYNGSANDAAEKTKVILFRGGFTTHAMNMGQRYLQLGNSYTVNDDGNITLHVAQAPPNPFIFQPGPAFLYVVMDGIPSNGSYVIVGNGQIGKQPLQPASTLPDKVLASDNARGTAGSASVNDGNQDGSSISDQNDNGHGVSTGAIVASVVGVVAGLGLLAALGVFLLRRRNARKGRRVVPTRDTEVPLSVDATQPSDFDPPMSMTALEKLRTQSVSDSSSLLPLKRDTRLWSETGSTVLNESYRDDPSVSSMQMPGSARGSGYYPQGAAGGVETPFDPYARASAPYEPYTDSLGRR